MPRFDDSLVEMPSSQEFTKTAVPPVVEVRIESPTNRSIALSRRVSGVKLTLAEISKAYEGNSPPVLTLDMAAAISGYKRSTLKRQISEGRFKNSVKRKKPVLFWRDRFVQELMQG